MIVFDTETFLIAPGRQAPPLVCVSWRTEGREGVTHWSESHDLLRAIWSGEVVGHNTAFDAAVTCAAFPDLVPEVFAAYAENRVECTLIREQLLDIRAGRFEGYEKSDGSFVKPTYSLATLVAKYLGRDILASKGPDAWRLRYSELWHLPIASWPREAIEYPLDDVRHTEAVYLAQCADPGGPIAHAKQRAAVDFALKLTSAWGLRTSPATVGALRRRTEEGMTLLQRDLEAQGFIRPNGVRDTKAVKAFIVAAEDRRKGIEGEAFEPRTRPTPKGEISLSSGALADLAEEYPILETYGEFGELKSVMAKDVAALTLGVTTPIHSRFGMASSDRVTSSKPNVQNWRVYPGIRECFVPREGYVFIQADYSGMELATLATVCLRLVGRSALADALIAGKDPHLVLGAQLMGTSYAEAVALYAAKDPDAQLARKRAKPINFGLPGGLGLSRLIEFSKLQYGVDLTPELAAEYRDTWFRTWPEMRPYFAYVRSLKRGESKRGNDYVVREVVTGRVRGGCRYTAACNDHFQALGASMSQRALFEVTREAFTVRESPLWGVRPVNYVHDEIIAEAPERTASAAARRMSRVMGDVARAYLPEVGCEAPPVVMRLWSKAAHEILDPSSGDLLPWHVDACGCQGCEKNRSQLSHAS